MQVVNINARSLVNKTVELECLLLDHNPDVAVVTETWLSDASFDFEVLPPRYRFVRKDRFTRGGGVTVILSGQLKFAVIDSDASIKTCWVKIDSFTPPLFIVAAYRPPRFKRCGYGKTIQFCESNDKKIQNCYPCWALQFTAY